MPSLDPKATLKHTKTHIQATLLYGHELQVLMQDSALKKPLKS